jgi:hypothetical protein
MTIMIHAPFFVHGIWSWHEWHAHTSNVQAACLDKATELGARIWDTSEASVMIIGEASLEGWLRASLKIANSKARA